MKNGFGSEKERQDRQMIHDNTSVGTDPITKDKTIILPVFNIMSPNEVARGRNVIVFESTYNELTLSVRKIYMSFDMDIRRKYVDQRPFIYAGDSGAAYSKMNKKVRLVHLIMGAHNNPLYDENTLKNSKLDPFGYKDSDPCNLVPHNIIPPTTKTTQITHDIDFLDDPEETIDMTEKVKNAIMTNTKNRAVSAMEKMILNSIVPTSADAAKDKDFKYYGVSKKKCKQGDRFVATCKGQGLGTYLNPVDAARAVNDFVIDNGLPYPVNNIPGFLETKFITRKKEKSLELFETWELANEVSRRLMPEREKF